MKVFSKTINDDQIKKILKKLNKYFIRELPNDNLAYFFKYEDKTISIFKTKKLLVQGNNADDFANQLLSDEFVNSNENLNQNKQLDLKNYIGCDEVGVGDYFGGIVTCAVYLEEKDVPKVLELGVKDSKDLTDKEMLHIYDKLIKTVKHEWTSIWPAVYNKLVEKYHNTHVVKTFAHNDSLFNLIEKKKLVNPTIVMDQFADRKNYEKYLNIINPPKKIKVDIFETKAENKYLAVACASIIARVIFLEQIVKISNYYKTDLYLGASNPKIIHQAKEIYKKGGLRTLSKVAKIDFKITNKVIEKT